MKQRVMSRKDYEELMLVTCFVAMIASIMVGFILGAAMSNTHWGAICKTAHQEIYGKQNQPSQ